MSNLNGKIALVSGASKGIGASIAKHLAAAGATVVVNYATSKTGADKVVGEIEAAGGKASAVQGDFSKPADITRVFGELKAQHGKLDILVNNAGVYGFSPLEAIVAEEFHRMFDLNVLGLLLATQAGVALMPPEGGSVINIGSVVASMPQAASTVYAATKGAVDHDYHRVVEGARVAKHTSQQPQPGRGHHRRCSGFLQGRLQGNDRENDSTGDALDSRKI